jgi:heptosyltransferase-2
MCLPAIRYIAARCQVSILCPEKLAAFWRCVPELHGVIPTAKGLLSTATRLRALGVEKTIVFPNSLRSVLEPWLAGIPTREGYKGHSRARLLSRSWLQARPKRGLEHQSLHYLRLAALSLDEECPPLGDWTPLPKPPALEEKDYLLVAPGAAYGPAKRWPAERFAETANYICKKRDLSVTIAGTREDQAAAAALRSKLEVGYIDRTAQTSLAEFIRLIAHAQLVLCNDSGAMHLASAFGTPCLAVFGSTEPRLTGPLGNCARVARHRVPCSPCFLRKCPIDFRCMKGLETRQTIKLALEAMSV